MDHYDRLVARLHPLVERMRKDVCWIRRPTDKFPARIDGEITDARLRRHLNGGPRLGAAFMMEGTDYTFVALLDLDSHQGETSWPDMQRAAARLIAVLRAHGLVPVAVRSTGGRGIHLYLIWAEPQDAYSVREELRAVLAEADYRPGTKGVAAGEVEVFPKQDRVAPGAFGNMAILPLAGESVPLDDFLDPLPREELAWEFSAPVPRRDKPEIERPENAPPPAGLVELKRALDAIPQETEPLEYDAWRNVIFGIHYASGGSDEGLLLAHEFSARSGKYDPQFLDERVWPYIRDDRDGETITDRYIFALAARYGYGAAEASDFDGLDGEGRTATVDEHREHRYRPIPAAEFAAETTPLEWHIKGVLPYAEIAMLYGASGSGKTFMALDMVLAIARGAEWRGRRVRKGRVAYVVAEGARFFRRRLRAWSQARDVPLTDIDVWSIPAAPSLLSKVQVEELIDELRGIEPVSLLVLDTYAQVTSGGDENSGEDMGKAIRNIQLLAHGLHCTVLVVHHSGKDEARGARGWSGIRAAVDAEYEVVRADDARVMTVTKLKDGEDGAEFGFRLETVVLGQDEDGDPITSCVVEHTDQSRAVVVRRAKPRGANEMAIIQAFADCAMSLEQGALGEDVIDCAVSNLGDAAGPRARGNLRRAITSLSRDGYFDVQGDLLLPGPAYPREE